jgi:hypothetical protein
MIKFLAQMVTKGSTTIEIIEQRRGKAIADLVREELGIL